MLNKIKVLIVDDSAFMRKALSNLISVDSEIQIIAVAKDGLEAVELTKKFLPDVITLDIEMPKLDGLSALKIIMSECPTPVIMVSSLTTEGADATIKALELGAVDFIPKEMSFINVNIHKIQDDLINKIKTIARQQSLKIKFNRFKGLIRNKATVEIKPLSKKIPLNTVRAVALGISTGGPLSLQKVIPRISSKINCPIFIVQHMPPKFTKTLADRLNSLSEIEVKEAEDGELVKTKVVYFAPGGNHLLLENKNGSGLKIKISKEPSDEIHKPSVNVMMKSVIDVFGKSTLGVIMTGMGKDGLEGMKYLKSLGGFTIAQDEETSVIYGMPKAIVDSNLADMILPLEKISEAINSAF